MHQALKHHKYGHRRKVVDAECGIRAVEDPPLRYPEHILTTTNATVLVQLQCAVVTCQKEVETQQSQG